MKLKDKIIIITGSSQGLGKTTATKLAKEGANIALVARTKELLEQVKDEINNAGGKAEYFVCDIRELKQVQSTVKAIIDKYSHIDIVINNAGVWTDDELESEKPEMRQNAFHTNVIGHINFINEVLPILKKQNKGHIFNVISTAGASDIPAGDNTLWKTYGASKWAMVGFSKALSQSLRDTKVKVTQFMPGGFESNLYENANRPNPHNQPWMMKTEDVADFIVFALTRSDDVYVESMIVSKMM